MLPFDPNKEDNHAEEDGQKSENSRVYARGSYDSAADTEGFLGALANQIGPQTAKVDRQITLLQAMNIDDDLQRRAAEAEGAIAFVHFDATTPSNNIIEALIHHDDLTEIDRGLYVLITSNRDKRRYTGRIVEGPFFDPDVLKRDSTPVQFIILNQGQGKVLSLPEYHARVEIEILGEETDGLLFPATRRPHPASPVFPYDSSMMSTMLGLQGNILLGRLDTYEDVFVRIDEKDKNVLPRNLLTVGTIGSGKSNTNQVIIEETLKAGYAQVVVDPEGEYTLMDEPSDASGIDVALAPYKRKPSGVKKVTVYRPPRCASKRPEAKEFSVPFDSLSPELIVEITEMNENQRMRFSFLYEQAIALMRKEGLGNDKILGDEEEADLSRGYPGMTLEFLLDILDQEFAHYEYKRREESSSGGKKSSKTSKTVEDGEEESLPPSEVAFYCRVHRLKPLLENQQDSSSYGALRKKLRELRLTRIFDRPDAPELNMLRLSEPGRLSIIDMSDCDDRQVKNIIIADLLARMYRYKMNLSEEENNQHKVFLTIEEAHGFVSRENKDKMEQTLSQLRRIARRGRKRWLALHFVTQSPQHLPSELFELANNKIIHQTTGTENLRVLKAAAGTINEGIWDDVPSLGLGRAIVVSHQFPHPIIVRVRPAASRRNYML